MTLHTVLLWALGIIAFICSLPFLLWGLYSATDAFASLFFERHSDAHEALHFCLSFGIVVVVPHAAPYLWIWWKRRQQQRAQAAQRPRTRHPGTSVPPVGASTAGART